MRAIVFVVFVVGFMGLGCCAQQPCDGPGCEATSLLTAKTRPTPQQPISVDLMNETNASSDPQHDGSDLGKSLGFILRKLVQLETVVELQQAKITTLEAKVLPEGLQQTELQTHEEAKNVFHRVFWKHRREHSRHVDALTQTEDLALRLQKGSSDGDAADSAGIIPGLGSTDWGNPMANEFERMMRQLYNNFVAKAAEELGKLVQKTWDGLEELQGKIDQGIRGLQDKWNELKNEVEDKWNEAKNEVEDKWNEAKNEVEDTWNEAKNEVEDTWNEAKNEVEDKWNEAKNAIEDKATEAWNELETHAKGLWNTTTGFAGKALEPFKKFVDFFLKLPKIAEALIKGFDELGAGGSEEQMSKSVLLQEVAKTAKTESPAVGKEPRLMFSNGRSSVHVFQRLREPEALQRKPKQKEAGTALLEAQARAAQAFPDFQRSTEKGSEGLLTADLSEGPFVEENLLTQFDGREYNTKSCLAFAPQGGETRTLTQADWQVPGDAKGKQEFIKLEPFAVPCENKWMYENRDAWEGFSFYRKTTAIEKCVQVSLSFSIQPVLALVAGLEIDFIPAPLVDLQAVICWPDKVYDYSMRTPISSITSKIFVMRMPVLQHTFRLTKRFMVDKKGPLPDYSNDYNHGLSVSLTRELGFQTFGWDSIDGLESFGAPPCWNRHPPNLEETLPSESGLSSMSKSGSRSHSCSGRRSTSS
ncbi:SETVS [Symbiodinium sp. CCMP2592]|nr:SETVS [Symbiodinium sp. CCMP2592]